MGRKKRRRRQTDNIIQFARDPSNIAEEMLRRVIDIVDMKAYQNEWARTMLRYQSEDDPHIKQTYEEYVLNMKMNWMMKGSLG